MSDAIRNLPLPVNWARGLEETWEFKTDIFRSRSGFETRSSLREFPRRTSKFSTLISNNKNPDYRQLLAATQHEKVRYPDVFRKTPVLVVSQSVVSGEVDRSYFSTGDNVCVQIGKNTLFGCVVENRNTDLTLDFVLPLEGIETAHISPCLVGRSAKKTSFTFGTSSVATGSTEYRSDFDPLPVYSVLDMKDFVYYRSRPLILWKPNWGQPVREEWTRREDTVDLGYGAVTVDILDSSPSRTASYSLTVRDRSTAKEILSFFSWCRGRQASFYAPTWVDDFIFREPVFEGQTEILVAGTSVFELFEGSEVFESISIAHADQVFVAGIVAMEITGGDTRIALDAQIPESVAGRTRASWLLRQRFSSDKMTFEFLTDEVSEVQIQTVSVFADFETVRVGGNRLTFNGAYLTINAPSPKQSFSPITIQGRPIAVDEDFAT